MNRFLIAAGVGALLIVAQTAVSATYNPLDRVDATAKDVVAAPVAPAATAATSTDRGYTAFADKPVRFDAGLYEVTTEKPATEPVVSDRVSAEPTSYNSLITQATTPSELEAYVQEYGRFLECGYGFCGGAPYVPIGLGIGALAYGFSNDNGETD